MELFEALVPIPLYLYLHSLHQDPVFPAAALSDTDAVSDSSTASNISAESPPPPGTAQQLIVLL